MCGIWCSILSSQPGSASGDNDGPCSCSCVERNQFLNKQQEEFVRRRGPDAVSTYLVNDWSLCSDNNLDLPQLKLMSSVLWTQGDKILPQPYVTDDESKLMLFNGDIYSFNGFQQETPNVIPHKNDGQTLFENFVSCQNVAEEMCHLLGNLQGPFAFIYVDKAEALLYFARDFYGRESLLFSYEQCQDHEIDKPTFWNFSSVSVYKNVIEVPTSGLFCVDLKTKTLNILPYSRIGKDVTILEKEFGECLKKSGFIKTFCSPSESAQIQVHFSSQIKFPNLLDAGNVDYDILSALVREANKNTIAKEFLRGSINVLESFTKPFLECLRESVRRRVMTLPEYCKNCMKILLNSLNGDCNDLQCDHAKVGVLFSGGLDSTVIAYLAAEALPAGSTLDLITVAFSKNENFNVPDRETAIASYQMIKSKFEEKRIQLVLVNVGKAEVEAKRRERIKDLISPLKSVLDDSVGVCLWFASSASGQLYCDEVTQEAIPKSYSSPIRVVLLGSGADELLGGYGRHRSAYEKSGWLGLASEMQMEIDRISIRNMGRDNRIVSDHGLCPRMPFLDETVVNFLTSQCDLWVKCCPLNVGPLGERGTGEKLLLRASGAQLFGEQYLSLALFPKRAMQFGSRIAKLESSKEKGGDSCNRLL